ncbi:Lrp/AsnC family transcriptional regulator [Streptomyces sp. SDT5-1]|uniref:Lrp/AsnC family transcriptional regulator n=1 Tax=Streptomyces sp. SDT5-1 TaxID=3406418 RepID=UPI003FD5A0E0
MEIGPQDVVGRQILAELQRDGRLTITELAERVRLSVSRCQRRVRELERAGVLRGYHAVVNPVSIGLGFEVLVFVNLNKGDGASLAAFDAAVAAIPEVVQAERLYGIPDYLLRVVTADNESYQRLFEEKLGTLPTVERLSSTIVMKPVVGPRPLPT